VNSFDLEIGWAMGLVLGTVRATPAIAFGVVIGQPLDGGLTTGELVTLVAMNAFIGFVLGWLLGLAIQPFAVAGSILDLASGLSVGALFDPESGSTPGSLSRMIDLGGRTLIIIAGGLGIAAQVLHASVQAVALDGSLQAASVIGPTAARAVSQFMRAGLELALPVLAVLFLVELTMGLVSRVSPQINVFLLGMPIKLLTTFLLMGSLVSVFPATADRAVASTLAIIRSVLRSFAG
jgi:flagellar biosynthesis protein FliR